MHILSRKYEYSAKLQMLTLVRLPGPEDNGIHLQIQAYEPLSLKNNAGCGPELEVEVVNAACRLGRSMEGEQRPLFCLA